MDAQYCSLPRCRNAYRGISTRRAIKGMNITAGKLSDMSEICMNGEFFKLIISERCIMYLYRGGTVK